jgi:hypothetical protein
VRTARDNERLAGGVSLSWPPNEPLRLLVRPRGLAPRTVLLRARRQTAAAAGGAPPHTRERDELRGECRSCATPSMMPAGGDGRAASPGHLTFDRRGPWRRPHRPMPCGDLDVKQSRGPALDARTSRPWARAYMRRRPGVVWTEAPASSPLGARRSRPASLFANSVGITRASSTLPPRLVPQFPTRLSAPIMRFGRMANPMRHSRL